MKRFLKWALRLFLVAVLFGLVAVVIIFLSRDAILAKVVEHSIRKQTGMDVSIGLFHAGIREPVIEIKDIRINNPKGFGDTPLIVIPEIHVEYDRDALTKSNQIHINLLRINLGELDIVKNEAGETNIFALGVAIPNKDELQKNPGLADIKKQTGYDFDGIDLMNVSVGTFKYIDMKDPANNRTQLVGMTNVPAPHIKSAADLTGLGVLIVLRSDNFFQSLVDQKTADPNMMKQLGF